MSGYIKIRKDLTDDPRLADIAEDVEPSLSGDALCDASRYALLGVTVTLWCYADTHIRDDDTLPIRIGALAKLLRFPESALRKLPAEWLTVRKDGTVHLPGYREKNGLISREKRKEAARDRTQKWRESRRNPYANRDASQDAYARNGDASRTHLSQVASPSPSPSPVSTSLRSVDRARKRAAPPRKRCPEDFDVPETERAKIRSECPDVDLIAEERKFRDYEFARSRSDWLAAWRYWMRKAQGDTGRINGHRARPTRYDELRARAKARAETPREPSALSQLLIEAKL